MFDLGFLGCLGPVCLLVDIEVVEPAMRGGKGRQTTDMSSRRI
jgi:hypothetical protein